MHSRHSSIYQAAEEWLDSFNDSECILTDSDEDGESFDCWYEYNSCLSFDFLDTNSKESKALERRKQPGAIIIKKQIIDKRMSGDVCCMF